MRARLSSGARKAVLPAGLVALSVAAAAATLTLQQDRPKPASPSAPAQEEYAAAPAPNTPLPPRTDPLWRAIDQWDRLRQSDRLAFDDYAAFLTAHPGWPGEAGLRRAAEKAIPADGADPARVAAFFDAMPPTTQPGRVRQAEALLALGKTSAARDAAAAAWIAGAMAPDDENRLTAKFAGQFTPAEQDKRMERLLWDRAAASAQRQLPFVSPARKPLYAARLAFQTKAADAATQAAALGPGAERDAGFVIDKAQWMRDGSQWGQACAWLATPRTFDAPPFDAARYLATLLDFAKASAADHQWQNAYGIALGADAAFAAGTDISQRPLPERDPYTSLVWLGGTSALKGLARPKDAEAMFQRYARASQTPGTRAKGDYWAGRAATAAGDTTNANLHFDTAAANVDQFYGQLATERLGRTIAVPADPPAPTISAEARQAFMGSELVHAARLLGEQHEWQDQTAFIRQIAANAKTDGEHALAGELARSLRRPDLGVIVSRSARASGTRDPLRIGFPTVPVPPALEAHWTMIHAIARQESQFDREATSPVGARGLVQLMPGTAREQAGKLGLPWDPSRLTEDVGYNVMLGSAYFDRMLTYYDGSYVLAVAAYNAGPGNVNRFLRNNGDPRQPGVDVVDWIEAIPLSETRAYVQKVLENAVVYDLYNPARARTPEKDRLSYYLGRKSAG